MDDDWKFSKHAIWRALEMAVDGEEIRRLLYYPEKVISSGAKYPGTKMHLNGRVGLVVNPALKRVVTVIWDREVTGGLEYDRTDMQAEMARIRDSKGCEI